VRGVTVQTQQNTDRAVGNFCRSQLRSQSRLSIQHCMWARTRLRVPLVARGRGKAWTTFANTVHTTLYCKLAEQRNPTGATAFRYQSKRSNGCSTPRLAALANTDHINRWRAAGRAQDAPITMAALVSGWQLCQSRCSINTSFCPHCRCASISCWCSLTGRSAAGTAACAG
jgi:hypothetical protein